MAKKKRNPAPTPAPADEAPAVPAASPPADIEHVGKILTEADALADLAGTPRPPSPEQLAAELAPGNLVRDGNLVGVVESIDEGGRSFVFQPIFTFAPLPEVVRGINPPRHVPFGSFRRFTY